MTHNPTKTAYMKEVIKQYDFYFKKELGQNFITDENLIKKILSLSGITQDDYVLEIGPGLGALTYFLTQQCRQVVAVEKDSILYAILKDNFADEKSLTLLNQDILKFDFSALDTLFPSDVPLKVISNLPYSITSAIIQRLLENASKFSTLTLMMQKEVAARLSASPGTKDYGSLTLFLAYYADCETLINVPSTVFYPRPNVDSSVVLVRIKPERAVQTAYEKEMFAIIKAAFAQRRKTLVNTLSHTLNLDKAATTEAIEQCGIRPTVRGETLTLDDFARLADVLSPMMQ